MNKKENIRGIFSQLTHLFSRKVGSCASRCGSYKFESPLLPPLEAIKNSNGKGTCAFKTYLGIHCEFQIIFCSETMTWKIHLMSQFHKPLAGWL